LEVSYRGFVKDAIISALNTDNNNIRRAVAMCVAAIAAIEMPRGEWVNLIDIMAETAHNDDINVRLSSIQTLGYICDELLVEDLTQD
jgi:importin subunit beta-1